MTLDKNDKDYYAKISKMRKNKVGGQWFKKNPELAKEAQRKSVETRRRNAEDKDRLS